MKLKKEIKNNFTTVHNTFLKDRNLGINARGILITMLSLPDTWDFNIKGLASILPDGNKRIATALRELEKYKYLIRERVYENGKVVDWDYIISDEPLLEFHFVNLEKENIENEYIENVYAENRHDNKYTNQLNTNQLITNQSINLEARLDMMDRIKSNISYDLIWTNDIADRLDELVEIMTDCCVSVNPIKVGGQMMSSEIVKSRMLKISSEHIVYVLSCMEQNTSKINNIKSYLITALYNSVATMDSYYRSEVNSDMKNT